jgi:uncharacterized damage-inducible protein DinB
MTPYSEQLGERDPLTVLAETPRRVRELAATLGPDGLNRPYAPGKWTARQILAHLAHVELTFGTRFRQAVTLDKYVVEPFDQDQWMAREPLPEGNDVIEALCGLRQWNLAFFRSLTPAEQARTFQHPERGTLSVGWLLELMAGHDLNHLAQIEMIASGVGR